MTLGHLEVRAPCPWDAWSCDVAAIHSRVEVLQWLRAQDPSCPWDEATCSYAAKEGNIEVLQWMRAQDPPCPWSEVACNKAAAGGHVVVLQWLLLVHGVRKLVSWLQRVVIWRCYNGCELSTLLVLGLI
jgi:hypothetical protein